MIEPFQLSPLLGSLMEDPGELWLNIVVFGLRCLFVLVLCALWLAIFVGIVALAHYLLSLPLRRAERARLFLDLLEGALQRGQSVEAMVLSVAQTRDRTLGLHFYYLATYIESGLRFKEALAKVPYLLLPQITAMLAAGESLGDMAKVLPACREILRERPASVRTAKHYLVLATMFVSPAFVAIILTMRVLVLPKFREVAAGMNVPIWPPSLFVFASADQMVRLEVLISLLLGAVILIYVGGPRLMSKIKPIADWIAWRVPWKHKQLQRTFSAMLAVLLDHGVPEAEAVRLAGDCTANEIGRQRAGDVIAALQSGMKLEDGLYRFDGSGEFHWRLANAAHARGGFLTALRGWHEALDAKAFQQEETAAHFITTGLVILNGVIVGLIVIGMFGLLIAILKGTLEAT